MVEGEERGGWVCEAASGRVRCEDVIAVLLAAMLP